MKRIVGVVLAGMCLLSVGSSYADDVRIGYVDVHKVLNECKAGQRVRGEIEKMVKERQESLSREEQQLKSMQQAFEKDKLLLSESQKQTRQQEFQQKVQAFQQARAKAQREIEQKEHEFTDKALPRIREIIQEVAKEQKLTLVFEKNQSPVLYAADGSDLTDKVIERFDAKSGN